MSENLSAKITFIAQKQLQHTRRYQILIFVIIGIYDCLPSNSHMNEITFVGFTPKHRCAINLNDTSYYSVYYNETYAKNSTLNYKCSIINENFTLSECKYGYVYEKEPIKTSITTEWDLVCRHNILPEVSQAIFNVGVMIGAITFGFLADKYGRRRVFISCIIAQSFIGTCVSFVTKYWQFVVLRVFVGCLEQGINIIGFILAVELFMAKERTFFASSYAQFWAIGGMYLSLLSYVFRDWRLLQLAISCPWISAIILIWILPESLIWLVSKNKLKEADKVLQVSVRLYRNYSLEKNYLQHFQHNESTRSNCSVDNNLVKTKECGQNIFHLFKTRNIRKITICVCVIWFFNVVTYYGWSFHTPNLYGNVYLNFFISHVVEAISYFLTMILISRFGRIKILVIFHIVAGVTCIVGVFIPETMYNFDLQWLQIVFIMIAKLGFSITGAIIYMYGPEIFPTCLRTTGSGLASMCGRIGGIIYPYINYLSKIQIPIVNDQLPLIIFGIMSLVATVFVIPLPETNNNPLPITIDDVENYSEFCKNSHINSKESNPL